MASIAQLPDVEVIVFYDQEQSHQINKVREHFRFLATLAYPVEEQRLSQVLEAAKSRIYPS